SFPDAAGDLVPRSEILFPPLLAVDRRGSGRDRDLDLDADQSAQSARKHPADAPPRASHPHQGCQPPGDRSLAAAAVNRSAPRGCWFTASVLLFHGLTTVIPQSVKSSM